MSWWADCPIIWNQMSGSNHESGTGNGVRHDCSRLLHYIHLHRPLGPPGRSTNSSGSRRQPARAQGRIELRGRGRGAMVLGRNKEACLADETTAQDTLKQNWSKYSATDKSQCVGMAKTGGPAKLCGSCCPVSKSCGMRATSAMRIRSKATTTPSSRVAASADRRCCDASFRSAARIGRGGIPAHPSRILPHVMRGTRYSRSSSRRDGDAGGNAASR